MLRMELTRSRCAFTLALLLGGACGPSLSFGATAGDIGGELACEVAEQLVLSLPREPLYARTQGQCTVSATLGGTRYLDAGCSQPVDTAVVPMARYCAELGVPGVLGDATDLPDTVQTWLSTPGTRMPLTLPGLRDSAEPYLGRVAYRSVSRADGDDVCALEMRVYTARPGARAQPAVIAFHGGSWSARRTGYPGLESLIAHFTDRGLVVFAPFYRLAGDEDGPAACRGWLAEDILADAEAALDWVQTHGTRYGAATGSPVLFGQSAGGYLAAWLAVERRASVAAALLMYPPTDVADFASQVASGRYGNDDGVRILERFLGVPASDWTVSSPRLQRLSLANRVAEGAPVAPLRAVHGGADALVPARQSRLLCAATRSRTQWLSVHDALEAPTLTARRERIACGQGGQLDLLRGADHALEVCVPGLACQAGDLLDAVVARDALADAYDWLAARAEAAIDAPVPPPPGPGGDGSGTDPGGVEGDDADVTDPVDSDPDPSADSASAGGGGGLGVWLIGWLFCVRLIRHRCAGTGTALAYKTVMHTAQNRGRSHAKKSDRVAHRTGHHRG
ncbi:MAG: alpha/beta hydrolase [Pseudomonadota bacterium]